MLTGKDLNYITDILDQNLIFMKKCQHYYNMLNDNSLKMEIENIYNSHRDQHNKLTNLL